MASKAAARATGERYLAAFRAAGAVDERAGNHIARQFFPIRAGQQIGEGG